MIDRTLEIASELGSPSQRIHAERFSAGTIEPGDSLMCCVSRAHGERLELDL